MEIYIDKRTNRWVGDPSDPTSDNYFLLEDEEQIAKINEDSIPYTYIYNPEDETLNFDEDYETYLDKLKEVDTAQRYLDNTDYIVIQSVEGVLNRNEEEFNEIKQKREEARQVIRSNR